MTYSDVGAKRATRKRLKSGLLQRGGRLTQIVIDAGVAILEVDQSRSLHECPRLRRGRRQQRRSAEQQRHDDARRAPAPALAQKLPLHLSWGSRPEGRDGALLCASSGHGELATRHVQRLRFGSADGSPDSPRLVAGSAQSGEDGAAGQRSAGWWPTCGGVLCRCEVDQAELLRRLPSPPTARGGAAQWERPRLQSAAKKQR